MRGLSGYQGARAAAEDLPLFAAAQAPGGASFQAKQTVALPRLSPGEHVVEDYSTLKLSLKAHPVSFLRQRLVRQRVQPAGALADIPNGQPVRIAGLVLVRQRPGTAKGTIFMTLEDETGIANVVIWENVFKKFRRIVFGARMTGVEDVLQKEQEVIHVIAHRLIDLTPELMDAMATGAQPIHPRLSRQARDQ